MKSSFQNILLPLILIGAGVVSNPNVLGLQMFGADSPTSITEIYIWSGSVLLILFGLLAIPWNNTLWQKPINYLLMGLITLMVLELACSFTFKMWKGYWSHLDNINPNRHLFEPHPYLVGSSKPNAKLTQNGVSYVHNSQGYRGAEFPNKKAEGVTRIVTVGGSTTYCVGVNNEETWPYLLGLDLGSGFLVLNLGVPGYSTTENLIQTALQLSELEPDIAIFQIGLNDLRNMNVRNLKPDYSNYHASTLFDALGLCSIQNRPSLASVRLLLMWLQYLNLIDQCPSQDIKVIVNQHSGIDEHAMSLYQRNIRSIVALCETQNIQPVFAPQIILEDALKTQNLSWWVRYVPQTEIDDMMAAYNNALETIADSAGVPFAKSVSEHDWQATDFVDPSHLNGPANAKLARLMTTEIQTIIKRETPGSGELIQQN